MSRTTQKRNPNIKERSKNDWRKVSNDIELYKSWFEILERPNPNISNKLANILTRLGLHPRFDDLGIFHIDETDSLPGLFGHMHPVVVLSMIGELNPGEFSREAQAATLKAATLVWAKAIENNDDEILGTCQHADLHYMKRILDLCDLESFWGRQRVGLSAKKIRYLYKKQEFDFTEKSYKDIVRRFGN